MGALAWSLQEMKDGGGPEKLYQKIPAWEDKLIRARRGIRVANGKLSLRL